MEDQAAGQEEVVGLLAAVAGDVLPTAVNNNSWWKKFLPQGRLFFSELGELDRILDGLNSDDSEEANVEEVLNDTAPAANDRWWKKVFPLGRHCSVTDIAFGACLETVATTMVMAVLTLNIYSATYFLAWSNDTSTCTVVSKPGSSLGSTSHLPEAFGIWLKIAAVGLPFTFVPLTVCISGTAKAARKGGRSLGFTAALVLGEVIYVVILGGFMTVCMSNAPYKIVGAVTLGLIAGIMWLWGCIFIHPKCLRGCVYPKCCCPEYDLEVGAVA